jgi:hypothetical protein
MGRALTRGKQRWDCLVGLGWQSSLACALCGAGRRRVLEAAPNHRADNGLRLGRSHQVTCGWPRRPQVGGHASDPRARARARARQDVLSGAGLRARPSPFISGRPPAPAAVPAARGGRAHPCVRIALVRSAAVPRHRLRRVLGHARAVLVTQAQVSLCRCVALVRSAAEPPPAPRPLPRPCRPRSTRPGCTARLRRPGPQRGGTTRQPAPRPWPRPRRWRSTTRRVSARGGPTVQPIEQA